MPVRHTLWLTRSGRYADVVTAGRRNFERVYALPEHVLSPELLNAEVPTEDAQRELVRRALRSHGIGTEKRGALPGELGERVLAIQRGIKDVLDPAGILNPGKKL